jgi:molybdopterin-guanine dinucleotide biosynthesis protein A
MYSTITGIILSGGHSSRMGTNKSFLKIGDKTIIERVKDLMQSLFKEVLLITNEPDDYKFLRIPIYKDVFPFMGPLAGIHSALVNSSTEKNFIISCDIPLITPQMIEYITDYSSEKPVIVPIASGYVQQVCGIYTKKCIKPAEKLLKSSGIEEKKKLGHHKAGCKVMDLINEVDGQIIYVESLPFYTHDLFFNMNAEEDYHYILDKLNQKVKI